MYSAQPNGADSGTINPAALSSELLNATSRGVKRSRSPDVYPDLPQWNAAADDDQKPRKRGRPMKRSGASLSESSPVPATTLVPPPMVQATQPSQAPHQPAAVPMPVHPTTAYVAPPQSSPPPKPTPKTTIKALPTVRDHTTDQLGPGNDEYLPREVDDAGEKKVTANGDLMGGREYRCRTFFVPNRDKKLFMLATECARVLNYRDSYLLFNKNRSLFKIIASQQEKDYLVDEKVLPFSYRSRQIAIVTARSMFRQFGSRVIVNGRRVRDDYWEAKARKQGFTEEDLAGEKRPGAAKARAAEAANAAIIGATPHQIVYSNPSQFGEPPQPQIVQPDLNDRTRDYSNLLKAAPRHEMTGPPYHDRTQSAPLTEIQQQATQAAEYNRSVTQGREMRNDYMQTMWRRSHEQPSSAATLPQPVGATDSTLPTTRGGPVSSAIPQPGMMMGHSPQLMMTAPPYSQSLHSQASQAPIRGGTGGMPASSSYAPSTGQMWTPHQAPQTPQHGYSSTYTTQQPQPQTGQHPPQATTPQMRSAAQVQPPMQFSGMPSIGQGYGAPSHVMYPADHQTPRQYMPPAAPSGSPAVTQAWSNSPAQPTQWWATTQPQ